MENESSGEVLLKMKKAKSRKIALGLCFTIESDKQKRQARGF